MIRFNTKMELALLTVFHVKLVWAIVMASYSDAFTQIAAEHRAS
jgi:hypothetical protein